ncbi:MAG: hypothetical protein ACERKD_08105 [Prolixibacteraceae bacterium]
MRGFVVFLFVFMVAHVMGQNIDVEAKYKAVFDNREYSKPYNFEKETIAGSQLNVEFGPKSNNEHRFRAGLNYFYEFGSDFLELKPKPILYYAYNYQDTKFLFGSFSRDEVPRFPDALLSDRFMYFYPTIGGLMYQKNTKNYGVSVVGDWVSRQTEIRREQFMISIAGALHPGNLIMEIYLNQFHNGGRTIPSVTDYIDDYLSGVALFGFNFANLSGLDKAEIKTGILTTTHRDRQVSRVHVIAHSSYSEILLESHRVGAEIHLKFGGLHQTAFGDDFYETVNNYVRTNIYFVLFHTSQLDAHFTWSLHTYKGIVDHQQIISLSYLIR